MTNDNPHNPPLAPTDIGYEPGATLFDYYFATALGALISSESFSESAIKVARRGLADLDTIMVKCAASVADKALKEREKWLKQYR